MEERDKIIADIGNEYKYGFTTDIETETIPRGLNEDVVRLISQKKGEPEWVTVDLYTRKPGNKEYSLTREKIPFIEFLKERGFTIITIKPEDELHYANNFLTIAPRHIMAVGNQSAELQQAFERHCVKVEWIPLETLIKGYGAAHCMTQVIRATLAE